jgi:signal transduction protein with GAF and PtsI domain
MRCLHSLLAIICSVFDAYSAVLFLPSGEPDTFRIAAKFSLGDGIDDAVHIAPGQGVVGWIIKNKRPLRIANFDQKRNRLGYYASEDEERRVKAFMGCPLRGGEGALCIDSKRVYSLSDKDLKILDLFSGLAAEMERDAGLSEAGLTSHIFYQGLARIHALRSAQQRWPDFLRGCLEVLAETTGSSHAFLAVLGEQEGTYRLEGACGALFADGSAHRASFVVGSGLVGWVFRNGQPVFSDEGDFRPGAQNLFGTAAGSPPFGTVACLPLLIHRKTRAVLVLASPEPWAATEETKGFLRLAADNLALHLETLYLKNRLTET